MKYVCNKLHNSHGITIIILTTVWKCSVPIRRFSEEPVRIIHFENNESNKEKTNEQHSPLKLDVIHEESNHRTNLKKKSLVAKAGFVSYTTAKLSNSISKGSDFNVKMVDISS